MDCQIMAVPCVLVDQVEGGSIAMIGLMPRTLFQRRVCDVHTYYKIHDCAKHCTPCHPLCEDQVIEADSRRVKYAGVFKITTQ